MRNETKKNQNPVKDVEALLTATERLIGIYEQETEALKSSDTKTFLNLQENKIEMSHQYQNLHTHVAERKEELKELPITLKEKLQDMDLKFKNTAHRNLKALNAMDKSMTRLNERIMKAAREVMQEKRARYGADGSLTIEQNKSISIGLNKSA